MTVPPAPVDTGGAPMTFGIDAVVTILNVKLNCVLNKTALVPSVATESAVTLCGASDLPGAEKWTFESILYLSYEDLGAYDVLSAAVFGRVPVPFTVSFLPGAPAANAPQFSGMLRPQAFELVNSTSGALIECDFTWNLVDAPQEDYGTGPQPIGTQSSTKFPAGGLASTGNGSRRSAPEPAASSAA
jgi:hypothetical protein